MNRREFLMIGVGAASTVLLGIPDGAALKAGASSVEAERFAGFLAGLQRTVASLYGECLDAKGLETARTLLDAYCRGCVLNGDLPEDARWEVSEDPEDFCRPGRTFVVVRLPERFAWQAGILTEAHAA
jgi:hypothetical protein